MTDHLLHRELTAGCARCQLIREQINVAARAHTTSRATGKALADITAVLSEATP